MAVLKCIWKTLRKKEKHSNCTRHRHKTFYDISLEKEKVLPVKVCGYP